MCPPVKNITFLHYTFGSMVGVANRNNKKQRLAFSRTPQWIMIIMIFRVIMWSAKGKKNAEIYDTLLGEGRSTQVSFKGTQLRNPRGMEGVEKSDGHRTGTPDNFGG